MDHSEPEIDGYSVAAEFVESDGIFSHQATDTDGDSVVVKVCDSNDLPAVAKLGHEKKVLELLSELDCAPALVEYSADPIYLITVDQAESTLEAISEAEGPIVHSEAVELIGTFAAAISQVHAKGVTHNFISPAVLGVGKSGEPFVSDFTNASIGGVRPEFSPLVPTAYSPPEIFKDASTDGDNSVDVYGLAASLWALIVGKPPFQVGGLSTQEAVKRISGARPNNPTTMAPAHIWKHIGSAMVPDPTKRTNSVAGFASQLAGVPVAESDGPGEQAAPQSAGATTESFMAAQLVQDPRTGEIHNSLDTDSDGVGTVPSPSEATSVGDDEETPSSNAEPVEEAAKHVGQEPESKPEHEPESQDLTVINSPPKTQGQSVMRDETDMVEVVTSPAVEGRRQSFPWLAVAATALVTTMICAAAFSLLSNRILGREVVGDYVGMSFEDAEKNAFTNSLIVEKDEVRRDGTEVGDVLSQFPAPGTKVDQGSRIILTVSVGLELRQLPDVEGLPLDEATEAIVAAGFELGKAEPAKDSATIAKGNVVDLLVNGQRADSDYPSGTVIDYALSTGLVAIPNISGDEIDLVLSQQLRLQVVLVEQFSNTVEVGEIIRTQPAKGSKVAPGTVVTVFLATDKPIGPQVVPDVRSSDVNSAVTQLKARGFKVQLRSGGPDCGGFGFNNAADRECRDFEADRVWTYEPQGQAPAGSTVRVFASQRAIRNAKVQADPDPQD